MKVPLHWLAQYVTVPNDMTQLVYDLTAIGHMQDKQPVTVKDDVVLDLEVRQNRSDCLSLLGIAREVAAITRSPVTLPTVQTLTQKNTGKTVTIHNHEQSICRRFIAVHLTLPKTHAQYETPVWMKEYLNAYGIKTISPLVDITNYVMVEYGEPMHAFDAAQVKDQTIVIRKAADKESITVLGGRTIALSTQDLVIADADSVLSFAGIIGGDNSGVNADTQEVILEAATYNHAAIRRSSLRHQIRTEASTRHEKILHTHLAEQALSRAVYLAQELLGATLISVADSYPQPESIKEVTLQIDEVKRLGGVTVAIGQAAQILSSLGFDIVSQSDDAITVHIPYWRTDIEQEADLVEEVLRLYGYDHIQASLPSSPPPPSIASSEYALEEAVRDMMVSFGFDEQITEPLVRATKSETSEHNDQIVLQNALNADKNALRTHLYDGLLHAAQFQQKLGRPTIKIFEIGRSYHHHKKAYAYTEQRELAVVFSDTQLSVKQRYLTVKGYLEAILGVFATDDKHTPYTIHITDTYEVVATLPLHALSLAHAHGYEMGKLYTQFPKLQTFDISLYLPFEVAVDALIKNTHRQFEAIERIKVTETPQTEAYKGILLTFSIQEQPDKEAFIHAVGAFLSKTYQAVVR